MAIRNVHPFPARMAPEIAIKHLEGLCASGWDKRAERTASDFTVVDPMCGSGTVLSHAAALGYRAIGVDCDPLAVLMSSVATSAINAEALPQLARRAVQEARGMQDEPILWDDSETVKFSEYWFGDKQRNQLARLSHAIGRMTSEPVRNAMRIALSRTIDTKTPKASLAADTSHSRPHRVLKHAENIYDVYDGFTKSADQLSNLLSCRVSLGDVEVKLGDARHLPIEDDTADVVITSPPYLNAIDYMRGHRLSLIWMGYTIPQLRQIRSDAIGSERALVGDAESSANDLVQAIEQDEEHVPMPDKLPKRTLIRYANDLISLSSEIKRVAKPGAKCVTVIGNSAIRGNFIRNDTMMRMALEHAGACIEEQSRRVIPDSSRYLPITSQNDNSPLAKRMREEIVLVSRF